jgi:hypothetical protein
MIESPARSARLRGVRWLRNPWFLGVVGALLAWLDAGYRVAGPDQQLYIPYIRHFADPALYAGDYIFANANYRATLYVPLVGLLHRYLGGELEPLLAGVHALSLFLLFSGLAATAARLSRGPAPAWLVAFLSWPPPIPGAAAALWEPTPHPRTLAMALAVWSLRHALDARALPAALLAAASFAIHPLVGIGALAGAGFAFTLGPRRALVSYGTLAALLAIAVRLAVGGGAALPLGARDWWQQVAVSGFLVPFGATSPALRSLLLWLLLFLVVQPRARNGAGDGNGNGDGASDGDGDSNGDGDGDVRARRLARFGQAFALLLAIRFAGVVAHSPLLLSLQLARCGYLLLLAALLLTARRLDGELAARRLPLPLYVATAALPFTHTLAPIFAGLFLALAWPHLARAWPRLAAPRAAAIAAAALVAVVAVRLRPHREHDPPADDWLALQRWAARATPVDARFLAPPRAPDFRVFSARASVVGTQDGQPAIFDEAYAAEWQRRRPAVAGYATHDCAALADAARRFDARYLVIDQPCALPPPAHTEGQWRVYDVKMRQP